MLNSPTLKEFTDETLGFKIRVTDQDGQEWFVAKDVCDLLEIKNPTQAVENLDDDETSTCPIQSIDQVRNVTVINESGLYALIFRSRKPQAKEFRRWVTAVVLPAIRRSGSFNALQGQASPPMPIEHPVTQCLLAFDAFKARGVNPNKILFSLGNLFQSSLAGAYQSQRHVLPMVIPPPPDPASLGGTSAAGRFSSKPESATSRACEAIRSVLEESPPLAWSALQKKSGVDASAFRNGMRRFQKTGEVIQVNGLWALA